MERNIKDTNGMVCSCDNCQNGNTYQYYHKYFWLRWLLGLIVIAMVFGLGIKIGEFKGYFDSTFGPESFRHDRMDRFYPMMNVAPSATSTPTTNSTTTKTK